MTPEGAGERDGGVGDSRIAAVLDVLKDGETVEVAERWNVDPDLLRRWVADFVAAGTAQVTNRPGFGEARQRDRFLAAFAHEVRTPLTAARGWTALLESGAVPPEQVRASLSRLSDAIDRLTERALDVELMAAASMGRLTLKPGTVTVAGLAAGFDGLDRIEGGELELVVDPTLFPRALRDLWSAADSQPAARARWIEASVEAPWVEIRVVREADPIDPAVLQALFEPFDLNDDGTGVTIGLYLARALAVAHGGSVGIEQDDSRGVFWVRVPVVPTPTPLETP